MANKMFRLHTQYTKQYKQNAERLTSAQFNSFNIVRGTGYWKGVKEKSMTIEIIGGSLPQDERAVRQLAKDIKHTNEQDAVYLTITELETADLI